MRRRKLGKISAISADKSAMPHARNMSKSAAKPARSTIRAQLAHEWEEGIESYVREKPLQAVLIAAGVGLLLGALWKRS